MHTRSTLFLGPDPLGVPAATGTTPTSPRQRKMMA